MKVSQDILDENFRGKGLISSKNIKSTIKEYQLTPGDVIASSGKVIIIQDISF